jgi:hypothetical protein
MRVAVRPDEGEHFDAVAADLLHHVAKDAERGRDLHRLSGLRSGAYAEHGGKGCRGDEKQASVHGGTPFPSIKLPDVCVA